MSSKKYFSYIRVSTQRQAQQGTSLAEQKAAIERYGQRFNLQIVKHFEEHETAAKRGRPVLLEMLKGLRSGRADGVIIHKIDRAARNRKDWADVGNLTDEGIEVHFVDENIDLTSRGGRLTADIKAVIAADYIYNLREEVKKGFYGRLKQGFYPMPAPIGYLDAGGGQVKQTDPIRAPLVRKAFELYSGGEIGLVPLSDRMFEFGLRSKRGNKVTENSIAAILHNPFYMGLIRIDKTGEMFAGKHSPLISKSLFDRVQAVFEGKHVKTKTKHFFVFRRHIKCAKCGRMLIPEKQKIYVYYRCQTRNCTAGTINEAVVNKRLLDTFSKLEMNEREYAYLRNAAMQEINSFGSEYQLREKQTNFQLKQINGRLSKVADAYIDGVFDIQTYNQKRGELLREEKELQEKLANLKPSDDESTKKLAAFLELASSAYLSYKIGNPDKRRDLVKMITSNFSAEGKSVSIKLEIPFQMIAERPSTNSGGAHRAVTRTFRPLVKKLVQYFRDPDTSKSNDELLKYLTSKTPPRIARHIPPRSHARSS